jgi:hypothetical protein
MLSVELHWCWKVKEGLSSLRVLLVREKLLLLWLLGGLGILPLMGKVQELCCLRRSLGKKNRDVHAALTKKSPVQAE